MYSYSILTPCHHLEIPSSTVQTSTSTSFCSESDVSHPSRQELKAIGRFPYRIWRYRIRMSIRARGQQLTPTARCAHPSCRFTPGTGVLMTSSSNLEGPVNFQLRCRSSDDRCR